jgi:hypothetical protein
LVAGDNLGMAGQFADKNVGLNKAISVLYSGADAANYNISNTASVGTGSITPATLTYIADAVSRMYGVANPPFTGTVAGFVDSESLATATTGSTVFSSLAKLEQCRSLSGFWFRIDSQQWQLCFCPSRK